MAASRRDQHLVRARSVAWRVVGDSPFLFEILLLMRDLLHKVVRIEAPPCHIHVRFVDDLDLPSATLRAAHDLVSAGSCQAYGPVPTYVAARQSAANGGPRDIGPPAAFDRELHIVRIRSVARRLI